MELRSDIAAAAEGMIARGRVDRELRELADHLQKRERVRRLCSGTFPAGYGLMAVTNRRVVLLRAGQRSAFRDEVPLRGLSAVDWEPGLLGGTITIGGPDGPTELKNVELVEGEEIVRYVRARSRSRARLGMLRGRSPEAPPQEAARPSLEDAETEVLERVGSATSPEPGPVRRNRAWPVAAAAGLIGAVGVGFYLGMPQPSTELDAADTPQPAAVNVAPAPPAPPPVVGVVRVIDADSVEVAGGASGLVEVLGIVAPQEGQCGADEATRFATTKLLGAAVTLVTDPSQPSVDQAGRILAQVRMPNGADYAVLAARAGVVTYHDSAAAAGRADEIKAAQAEAEAAGAGLWGAPCHGDFGGVGGIGDSGGESAGPE